ncbi:MAG: tetratricopeptide repeat protein [Pseudomonadota bacterium]
MPEPSLGLMMILRDEAANLPRSLVPVAGCFDEVVVVDTGSLDDTPNICAQLGAKVFRRPWDDDFAAARNHAIAQASAAWLLWLDGDNAVTPAEVQALRRLLPTGGPAIIWAQEQVVPSGERLWQKRCFPRRPEVRFAGRVHEQLEHPPDWPNLAAPMTILHWGYVDPQRVRAKGAYYLSLLEQSLKQSPDDYYLNYQAGRCLWNLGRLPAAAGHLRQVAASGQARRANPELWAAAQHLLAQALLRLGDAPSAEALLDRLLEQMPLHGLSHYQRGRLAYDLDDWPGAAEHLSQALALGLGAPVVDLDPVKTLFLAHYFLARALERQGRAAEALPVLAAAVAGDPGQLAARTDLARLLIGAGRPGEARQHLHQVLAARPGDRQANHLLARMRGAA